MLARRFAQAARSSLGLSCLDRPRCRPARWQSACATAQRQGAECAHRQCCRARARNRQASPRRRAPHPPPSGGNRADGLWSAPDGRSSLPLAPRSRSRWCQKTPTPGWRRDLGVAQRDIPQSDLLYSEGQRACVPLVPLQTTPPQATPSHDRDGATPAPLPPQSHTPLATSPPHGQSRAQTTDATP